ncbi:MAG: tRNA dihydrouridine synthase DusB [Patescibacteria group bacterium]
MESLDLSAFHQKPFSWTNVPRPIVALAPLAGYTDSAYRQVVKTLTSGIVCFSELTSVAALHHKSNGTYQMLDFHPSEYPLIMQLFGKEVPFFIESGKILEDLGVAGIDINMGCPTTKITANECGSALLRDPGRAAEIVHALSKAVSIPVSVKTRLGYETFDQEKFFTFCTMMQDAGAKLLSLHGRTRQQGFSGAADWQPIYDVKKRLSIPVIGNGDIKSVADAHERLGNLDGIMVGRATLGNPWIIAEIAASFRGETYHSPKTIFEKLPIVRQHVRLAVEFHGEHKGIVEMRKHLASYFKGFQGASDAVHKVMQRKTLVEIEEVIDEIAEAQRPEKEVVTTV